MNKSVLLTGLVGAICACCILQFQPLEKTTTIPNMGLSSPALRAAYDQKRLADPATGLIPDNIRNLELDFAKRLPKSGDLKQVPFTYRAQGPFNFGGRTRAVAMDVSDNDVLIAGAVSSGIWRSPDRGVTWNRTTDPDQFYGATCLVQDTRAGMTDNWYFGSGERYNSANGDGALFIGGGVYKSEDGGESWESLAATYTGDPQTYQSWDKIWRLAMDPSSVDEEIYAATPDKLYKSIDGGASWTSVISSSGANGYSYSDVAVASNGVCYATFSSEGNKGGLWRSTDGDTWVNITPVGWPASFGRVVLAIDPNDENNIHFLSHNYCAGCGKTSYSWKGDPEYNSIWKYTYLSGDGSGAGGTWVDNSENLPVGPYAFDDFAAQGGYDFLIAVQPGDPNTVIIGGTNLYRSTSGFSDSLNTTYMGGYGETTGLPEFTMYPNHHPDQHIVFFDHADPSIMYSGNDGGLWRTNDINAATIEYESLNNGYQTTQFYTCAIDHGTEGSNEIMGGLQDNGTFYTNSADTQADWTMPWSYDGAYCAIPDGAEYYIASIQLGRMVKLEIDANGDMTSFARIDPQDANENTYDFINPFAMDPIDNNVLYLAAGGTIWRNDQIGSLPVDNTWDSITTGWMSFTATLPSGKNIASFGVTHSGSHRLYIGSSGTSIYRIDNANTGDPAITDITNGISGTGYVSSISVDEEDDDKLMVVYSNYNAHSIHYSEDAGLTWYRVGGNLEGSEPPSGAPEDFYHLGPYPSIRSAQIIPFSNGDRVYMVGTSVGLYATNKLELGTNLATDNTVWYQQAEQEIGNVVVDMMDYRSSDGFMAIATHGAGMFTSTINNPWGVNQVKESTPKKPKILLFPNPASTNMNLNFVDEDKINYQVQIIDNMGRTVQEFNVRTASANINIGKLSNGVYTLKATSKSHVLKQKFVKE